MIIIIALLINPVNLSYAGSVMQEGGVCLRDFEKNPAWLQYEIYSNNKEDGLHTYLKLALIDDATQEPAGLATYELSIYKVGGGGQRILNMNAIGENGTIVLDMVQGEPPTRVVESEFNEFLSAYKAGTSGKIVIENIPLETESRYHLYAAVIGTGCLRQLYSQEDMPTANVYFSVKESIRGGTLVVPEFPYHVILITSAVIGTIIAVSRTGLLARFNTS